MGLTGLLKRWGHRWTVRQEPAVEPPPRPVTPWKYDLPGLLQRLATEICGPISRQRARAHRRTLGIPGRTERYMVRDEQHRRRRPAVTPAMIAGWRPRHAAEMKALEKA